MHVNKVETWRMFDPRAADLKREPDAGKIAAFELPDSDSDGLPPERAPLSRKRKGRGTALNPGSRFDGATTVAFADGWDLPGGVEAEPPPVATTLIRDTTKSAISWNNSPDIGFDRAVNPYRGCEHGCIYCYARPTHAYLGYSPGLDFETKLVYKPEIADLLLRELSKPGYVAQPLALGSNTDPYQPIERTLHLTRTVLNTLERCNHPVSIVTKSASVLGDLDLLASMARRNLVRVWLSVTTLDGALARSMEPRASTAANRLRAMGELAAAGVPVGVLAAPMIPGLNDTELERILQAAADAGASVAAYTLLRLPHELKELFEDWLRQHVPNRARHVLQLVRDTRGGQLNDSRFGRRFSGSGDYAGLLAQRFSRAARQLGLEARPDFDGKLDSTRFRPPLPTPAAGRNEAQLSLF